MLRQRLIQTVRTRDGSATGPSRWTCPGHEEQPKGYLFNRTPLSPGQTRKWEDWELPCYVTSFLTIVILGVGLNSKPDLSIETKHFRCIRGQVPFSAFNWGCWNVCRTVGQA
ncbi:hypothetical protein PRUPE_5G050600 [Prunus persica]|uniref:Uncharacterized protein n=1 Tax=Prunus persica TaxID=3760 RepID=A0A251P3W8_PRUPE|nr:uncharacterized protein LOC18777288 [Prunus persica]ONI06279.1 hypothetical protein PRUPE_5G050600 [Prunus persica]